MSKDAIAKIIQARLRVPIMKEMHHEIVEAPLSTVQYTPIIEVSEVLEQFYTDMRKVLTSGAIRYFHDEYYSNGKAVDEASKLYERWFK